MSLQRRYLVENYDIEVQERMTDRTRREFMKESSAAVSFSLSDLFLGLLGGESSEPVEQADEFFRPDDGLMFNRGEDPAHPYDTQFQDFFSLDYVEGLRSPVKSLENYDPDASQARSLTVHMDDVRQLPESHPVRRMAELTPEPDPSGLEFGTSPEDYDRLESELKEVVRDAVKSNDGDWYDTWSKMEQDVEDVKKTVFEYTDTRKERNGKLEVQVTGDVDIPDSYTNSVFGNEVYHGEEFDAEVKDGKAFIQFHDSEFYSSPEKILSEQEYEEVREGEKSYEELVRDQKALFSIYRSSPLEKAFNF